VVGAKSAAGAFQRIISLMPPHSVFVEGFAGSAAITRRKAPASRTLLIERDAQTAAALRAAMSDRHVEIIEGDVRELLRPSMVDPGWCLYFDPPYVLAARRAGRRYYRHEWEDSDHVQFLEWVQEFKCPVLISGYWSEMYASRLEHSWRSFSFGVGTRRGRAIEHVWMNFPEPQQLHDAGYVGRDFTDRQRIKRKAARWVRMLAAMPPGERAAVLASIAGHDWAAAQSPPAVGDRAAVDAAGYGAPETAPAVPDLNSHNRGSVT
jgi:hypothetical protein